MPFLQQVLGHRAQILQLALKWGCRNVRIFGSTARGDDRDDSDVDFLVNVDADRSLVDFVAFKQDLEKMLNKNVDLVTEKSLHWLIRQDVLKEAVPL